MPELTASQTVGPFFKFALDHPAWNDLTGGGAAGERITIAGRVLDGDGVGVPDAMLELWQANAAGSYERDPNFRGFGRASTDEDGRFAFHTIRPGTVPGPGAPQAPHVTLTVFARGLLHHLITRVYFDDRADENARDPVLASIADPAARATLIATRDTGAPAEAAAFRFDVVLQGERETAFFDL
jgi:protocatechuate 3,4-dioxygenase alpha subunit